MGKGRNQKKKALNTPHVMLLLPATLINKHYGPKHVEFHACLSIPNLLDNNWPQLLLVVYLVKLCLTSFFPKMKHLIVSLGQWVNTLFSL